MCNLAQSVEIYVNLNIKFNIYMLVYLKSIIYNPDEGV